MKKKDFCFLFFLIIHTAESMGALRNFLLGRFSVGGWLLSIFRLQIIRFHISRLGKACGFIFSYTV